VLVEPRFSKGGGIIYIICFQNFRCHNNLCRCHGGLAPGICWVMFCADDKRLGCFVVSLTSTDISDKPLGICSG